MTDGLDILRHLPLRQNVFILLYFFPVRQNESKTAYTTKPIIACAEIYIKIRDLEIARPVDKKKTTHTRNLYRK